MVDIYVDQLWDWLISSLADLVLGLLIALASWLASRWVKRLVSRTAKRLGNGTKSCGVTLARCCAT